MAKQLKTNVHVEGKWYGPDYPQNKVPADIDKHVTNPAAFVEPRVGAEDPDAPDLRFRADDLQAEIEKVAGVKRAQEAPLPVDLDEMDAADVKELARNRGQTVAPNATKDDVIAQLRLGG